MKVILAQGNPEDKYQRTRHNVGWQVLDAVSAQYATPFVPKPKLFANIIDHMAGNERVLFVKPTTYYNETGRSLAAIKQFYKLTDDDILVVHDELALPFGTLRIRQGGSDAGNNGIKSINAHGGDFTWRLRVGVSTQLREYADDIDFVLGRFSRDEQTILNETVIPKSLEIIAQFISSNHTATSHTLID